MRESISEICAAQRRRGSTVVFTHGAFDLLHPGHLSFLEDARGHGDFLVVGVHQDLHIREYKGPGRPVLPLADRLRLVAALRVVDRAIVCPDENAAGLVREIRPDVYVKDNQAQVLDSVEARAVGEYGGQVHILPYTSGISTSLLIERLARTE